MGPQLVIQRRALNSSWLPFPWIKPPGIPARAWLSIHGFQSNATNCSAKKSVIRLIKFVPFYHKKHWNRWGVKARATSGKAAAPEPCIPSGLRAETTSGIIHAARSDLHGLKAQVMESRTCRSSAPLVRAPRIYRRVVSLATMTPGIVLVLLVDVWACLHNGILEIQHIPMVERHKSVQVSLKCSASPFINRLSKRYGFYI